jgi:hypothetical protein
MTAGTTVNTATTKPYIKYRTYLLSDLEKHRLALGSVKTKNKKIAKTDCGVIFI